MGRAIVREPKAFLMDEPLSNLDAKLRVGMRASLAQLHAPPRRDDGLRDARPGRGDDAGPARRGDARRADPPGRRAAAALRASRGTLFVAGVHRLARDEPRRGDDRRRRRRASGSSASRSTRAASGRAAHGPRRARHPARRAFEDAAFAPPRAADDRRRGRRARGARLGRARLLPRRRAARHRRGASRPTARTRRCSSPSAESLFTARVDPRTRARVGAARHARRRSGAVPLLRPRDGREPARATRPRARRRPSRRAEAPWTRWY